MGNNSTPGKYNVMKRPDVFFHEGDQDPRRLVASVKKKSVRKINISFFHGKYESCADRHGCFVCCV